MKKWIILLFAFVSVITSIMHFKNLNAFSKKISLVGVSKKTKSYIKKPLYAGLGKKSSVNGLYKTKSISGYWKKSGKSYSYVNSYSRSK